jgi:hypothetical protein
MAPLMQHLPVATIPEQFLIPTMRAHMVDLNLRFEAEGIAALRTEYVAFRELLTNELQPLTAPSCTISPLR